MSRRLELASSALSVLMYAALTVWAFLSAGSWAGLGFLAVTAGAVAVLVLRVRTRPGECR